MTNNYSNTHFRRTLKNIFATNLQKMFLICIGWIYQNLRVSGYPGSVFGKSCWHHAECINFATRNSTLARIFMIVQFMKLFKAFWMSSDTTCIDATWAVHLSPICIPCPDLSVHRKWPLKRHILVVKAKQKLDFPKNDKWKVGTFIFRGLQNVRDNYFCAGMS